MKSVRARMHPCSVPRRRVPSAWEDPPVGCSRDSRHSKVERVSCFVLARNRCLPVVLRAPARTRRLRLEEWHVCEIKQKQTLKAPACKVARLWEQTKADTQRRLEASFARELTKKHTLEKVSVFPCGGSEFSTGAMEPKTVLQENWQKHTLEKVSVFPCGGSEFSTGAMEPKTRAP